VRFWGGFDAEFGDWDSDWDFGIRVGVVGCKMQANEKNEKECEKGAVLGGRWCDV
jgi:hypothetical protein